MTLSVLELPELAALIAAYLKMHAILQCMLVSKRLLLVFQRQLFRRVVIRPPLQQKTIDEGSYENIMLSWTESGSDLLKEMRRHLKDIRDLELSFYTGNFLEALMAKTETTRRAITTTSLCTDKDAEDENTPVLKASSTATYALTQGWVGLKRLRVLNNTSYHFHPYLCPDKNILTLLRLNVDLVDLCLTSDILDSSDTMPKFMEILKTGLPRLRKLSIGASIYERFPLNKTIELVHASLGHISLRDLQCSFQVLSPEPHLTLREIAELAWEIWAEVSRRHASALSAPKSALTTLMLPMDLSKNINIHILKNCVPNLTKLSIQYLEPGSESDLLVAIRDHPLRLEHLGVGKGHTNMNDWWSNCQKSYDP